MLEDGEIVAEGPSLEALCSYERLVFHSEQRGLRQGNGISIGEVTTHNARVYGSDGQSMVEIAAGSPFGVEIDVHVHCKLERPVFSLGIRNSSNVLCVWNISDSSEADSHLTHDGLRLRASYADNKLMNGAYEVQFTLQDGRSFETIERVAGVTTFSIVGDSTSTTGVAPFGSIERVPGGVQEGLDLNSAST